MSSGLNIFILLLEKKIDEWLVTDIPESELYFLFELMERRSDATSTIFCTQYRKEDWIKRLENETAEHGNGITGIEVSLPPPSAYFPENRAQQLFIYYFEFTYSYRFFLIVDCQILTRHSGLTAFLSQLPIILQIRIVPVQPSPTTNFCFPTFC